MSSLVAPAPVSKKFQTRAERRRAKAERRRIRDILAARACTSGASSLSLRAEENGLSSCTRSWDTPQLSEKSVRVSKEFMRQSVFLMVDSCRSIENDQKVLSPTSEHCDVEDMGWEVLGSAAGEEGYKDDSPNASHAAQLECEDDGWEVLE